jgi:hypothetical protein
MEGFKDLSSLSNIQSAIQIHIWKPKSHFLQHTTIISNPKFTIVAQGNS